MIHSLVSPGSEDRGRPESSPGRLLIPTRVLKRTRGVQRSQVELGRPRGPVLSAARCLEMQWGRAHCVCPQKMEAVPTCRPCHSAPGPGGSLTSSATPSPRRELHPSPVLRPPPESSRTRAPAWSGCQSPCWARPMLCSGSGVFLGAPSLSLCLGLSPPISPALDEGRRPWPCSPARRGDEPDRALCLLWGPSTALLLPRPSDAAVWLGRWSGARWRLRVWCQGQEAGTPQEYVATACPRPEGRGRVT